MVDSERPTVASETRFRDIADEARSLVTGFIAKFPSYSLADFLARTNITHQGTGPIYLDLFNYAVDVKGVGGEGRIIHYSTVIENLTIRQQLSTGYVGPPVSWLFRHTDLAPTIHINQSRVSNANIYLPPLSHLPRTIDRIILHEIGHFCLHWEEIDPKIGGRPCNASSRIMENEAWLFACVVLGLCLGFYAENRRFQKKEDDAWKYVG